MENVLRIIDKVLPIVGIVAVILFPFVLYLAFKRRNSLLKIEKGKKVILQTYCGMRYKGFNLTYPLVRLALYDKFIVITSITARIVLNYNEIKKAEINKVL